PGLGKQRPKRPVDESRNKDLALGGAALSFEKSAGYFSRRIGVLAVIHRKWQKIPIAGMRIHTRRDQQLRVSILDQNGSVRLFGQFSCFKRQWTPANFNLHLMWSGLRHNFYSFRRLNCGCSYIG